MSFCTEEYTPFFCCTIITQGWMTFASGLLIYLNNFISISGPTYMWKWMRHQKCLRACTPYIYSVYKIYLIES